MHLECTRSSYKGKVYSSYRIARSIRRGDRVHKEVLFPLGPLSAPQAEQIQLILRTVAQPDQVLVALEQVEQLGVSIEEIATLLKSVASYLFSRGAYPDAEALYHRVHKIYKAELGSDHADVATILNDLAH